MRKLNKGDCCSDESNYEIQSEGEAIDQTKVCVICENKYTAAVKTICGHQFCEKCALSNYLEDSNCFACGKPTNGIFNKVNVIGRTQQKRESSSDENEEAVLAEFKQSMDKTKDQSKGKYAPTAGWYIP